MNRILLIFVVSLFLTGCSEDDFERLAFEKTLKFGLTKKCNEHQACIAAVDEQLPSCIEKGDYKKVLHSTGSKKAAEKERFSRFLFSCIVDSNGKPYFRYQG